MPDLDRHALDLAQGKAQAEELRSLLQAHAHLEEESLRDFFRDRRDLTALVGLYNPSIRRFDLVAREYHLFGTFRCDLAIGDSGTCAYTFVELEDAGPTSLFLKNGEKLTREWSPRFDHGYSQVVDWFYKLDDMTDTAEMEARLGRRSVDYVGVPIAGRDHHMGAGEPQRLRWRQERTIVNSRRIICVTYDQLVDDLTFRLDSYELAARHGG